MANRRKDRPVPEGFRRYDGNYEKTWYDVYTYNGVVFHHCWPNAGMFHASSGQYIEGERVFAINPEEYNKVMAFKEYTAKKQGFRSHTDRTVTVAKTRIGLGYVQLPWEYVNILYDADIPAIRFTQGYIGNGFKVAKNNETWYLAAKSFTSQNLIPYGLYVRDDDKETYTFILHTGRASGDGV